MIRVKDLENQTGVDGPHPILWCPECDARFSANKSDYFWRGDKEPFKCGVGHRVRMLKRVLVRTVMEEV